MRQKLLGGVVGVALALTIGGTALADSCGNVSRAPYTGPDTGAPVIRGNWIWLPSIGIPAPIWGFLPPGGPDSQLAGAPGANGNYLDGTGASLLDHSAYCLKGVNTDKSHGIVSGCE